MLRSIGSREGEGDPDRHRQKPGWWCLTGCARKAFFFAASPKRGKKNAKHYCSRNRQRPPPGRERQKISATSLLARRGVSGICRRQIALLAHAGLSDRLALGRARVRQLLHLSSIDEAVFLTRTTPGSLWHRSLVYGCLRQRPRTRARALEES